MKSALASVAAVAGRDSRLAGSGSRWTRGELLFWLVPVAFYFAAPSYLGLGNQILIAALFALSLDIALGYGGIVSLGHAAFFGVGAYTAGLLAVHGWQEPLTGLIAAAAIAALVGAVTGLLVARGNDMARLMVTLGVGFLLYEGANKATSITGGADGLMGITMAPVLSLFPFDIQGRTAFVYSFVVLLGLFVLARRLIHSPFGLAMRGIKEGPLRMPAIGTNVHRHLVVTLTISAGMAGVAGGLLAQTTQFVGLDSLSFHRSADVLIMLIIGGVGRLYGGLIGAAIFIVAHDILSTMNPVYWQFWLGLLLMVVVFASRGGVLAGVAALKERMRP